MTDAAVGGYGDAAGHAAGYSAALSQAANMLEVVRDQLQSAISVLEQPPPPTLWWGSARREYETAARELASTMHGLRSALAGEAQRQRESAAAMAAADAVAPVGATTAVIPGDFGGVGW